MKLIKNSFLMLTLILLLSACKSNKIEISNMTDKNLDYVINILKKNLNESSVDGFKNLVSSYNKAVKNTTLRDEFKSNAPEYDIDKFMEFLDHRPDSIGTNCRINAYMLLKDNIKIGEVQIDDNLLLIDESAIELEKIFNEKELENFKKLFTRVKTQNTKDVNIHFKNMQEHFKNIEFDKNIKLISVIVHDDLDGDYLFIGHCGVLVKDRREYLFLEKLSFTEPYQAIRTKSKEELYKILDKRYEKYHEENTVRPFIMENDRLVTIK